MGKRLYKELQSEGAKVCVVGDGITMLSLSESPDVGMAMTVRYAIEAADIILMRNDLNSVSTAIKLSKATLATIKQNSFGLFYNSLGILWLRRFLYLLVAVESDVLPPWQ